MPVQPKIVKKNEEKPVQKKVKTESYIEQQIKKDEAEIALLEKKLNLTSKRK